MRRELKATFANFAAGYTVYTQFRVELLLYMVAGLAPIYMMFAWMSLSETGIATGTEPGWFAAYFLVIYGTRQMSPIWLIRDMDKLVRLGELSPHLLRPVPICWNLYGWHLADNAIRLPVVLVFVPLGLWAMDAFPYLDGAMLPLYLLGLVLGMLVHIHLEMLVGCAAFWTNQSLALEEIYITSFYLLTGFTVPLAMFPAGMQAILGWLPFYYMFGFPAEILLGQHHGWDLVRGLLIQIGWLVVLGLAARFAWHRGLRRYTAAGA